MNLLKLSTRMHDRILTVSPTIGDPDGTKQV